MTVKSYMLSLTKKKKRKPKKNRYVKIIRPSGNVLISNELEVLFMKSLYEGETKR